MYKDNEASTASSRRGGRDEKEERPRDRDGERRRHHHHHSHRRSRSPDNKSRRRHSRERDADRALRRSHRDRSPRRRRDASEDEGKGNNDDDNDDDDYDRRHERRRRRSRSRDHGDHRDSRSSRRDSDRRRDGSRSRRKRNGEAGGDGNDKALQPIKRGGPLPSQNDSFVAAGTGVEAEPDKPKEKPNFGATGVLAAASNSVQQADGTTIALKYHEPPEARKPPARDDWRLFVFKGDDVVDTIPLASRSCWLVGRDAAVADLLAEHPSVSKQHAAIQFRHVERRNEFGDRIGGVKPYLIDLQSANGTTLNGEAAPESRYLELRHKDVVRFGQSSREYVVMLPPKG